MDLREEQWADYSSLFPHSLFRFSFFKFSASWDLGKTEELGKWVLMAAAGVSVEGDIILEVSIFILFYFFTYCPLEDTERRRLGRFVAVGLAFDTSIGQSF